MEDLLKNKFFWVALALGAVLLFVGGGGNGFIDRIADRVIIKLQKEYSPSPYGPGIDPDCIDVEKIRRAEPSQPPQQVSQPENPPVQNWEETWDQLRR